MVLWWKYNKESKTSNYAFYVATETKVQTKNQSFIRKCPTTLWFSLVNPPFESATRLSFANQPNYVFMYEEKTSEGRNGKGKGLDRK